MCLSGNPVEGPPPLATVVAEPRHTPHVPSSPAQAALAAPEPAKGKTISDALKAGKFTSCLALLEAAGAGAALSDPATTATVLCPTNEVRPLFLVAGPSGASVARTD
jgi:hypothetical protein